jgi:hypothetical protein
LGLLTDSIYKAGLSQLGASQITDVPSSGVIVTISVAMMNPDPSIFARKLPLDDYHPSLARVSEGVQSLLTVGSWTLIRFNQ